MADIYTVELVPGVTLHAAAEGLARAMDIISWLCNAPVASDAIKVMDADGWAREYGRETFDGVQECLSATAQAHHTAAVARQRLGDIRAVSSAALRRGDNQELRRTAALLGTESRTAKTAEAIATRLAHHLEALMRGEYTGRHRPGQVPAPDFQRSQSLHADGAFIRRSGKQRLLEAFDAAVDILGNIPGASAEVCQAYSILDSFRWNFTPPPDDVEVLQEQVSWLCELVEMAYRESFEMTDPDSKTIAEIRDRKLPRPVSVAEIRAAISRRPPALLDERLALLDQPATPGRR